MGNAIFVTNPFEVSNQLVELNKKNILVTGSSGLIGSEVCIFFAEQGFEVHGIDNNQREVFFGTGGSTRPNQNRLQQKIQSFHHYELDIRNRPLMLELIQQIKPQVMVHAAGQPSHDLAAKITFDDFDINAVGTLNLLEAARQICPESPFIFLSTNKVYGSRPNDIALKELETRWEYDDLTYENGISESFCIDQTMHSFFGVSKLAADILVQEYGRYYQMPTCCLRCGCVTGPYHAGVELHGFLNYLVQCNSQQKEYKIYGYKGKQVRDNIHAYDVASFIYEFFQNPRAGEVYNLGGGKESACSILEAFKLAEKFTGVASVATCLDEPRQGDHICYYSDLSKIRNHYPKWQLTKSLSQIFEDIAQACQTQQLIRV